MTSCYDVIVVGAGPAGARLAWLLSENGLKVLILEQKELPRYKPCGGGLTRRALEHLPLDLGQVIEDRAGRVILAYQKKTVLDMETDPPAVTLVMRDRFDQLLTQKALSAGAHLREKCFFRFVSGEPGKLSVHTSYGLLAARVIAGADGVNSLVSRNLGLRIRRKVMTALEAEVYFRPGITEAFQGAVHFDLAVVPRGYAWVFPKKDHLSIGLWSRTIKLKHLWPYLAAYLEDKGLADGAVVKSRRPHLLPYQPDEANIYANSCGLVLGDAAGLTDPITGEGIYFGLRQAEIAAGAIIRALSGNPAELADYNKILKSELLSDLAYANRVAALLYGCPGFSRRAFNVYGEKLGDFFLEIIAGRKSYRQLYRKIFDPARLFRVMLGGRG